MSILWHWSSNVWLWVLAKLNVSPIVVQVAREGRIWMSILWHWTSNVWLWVLTELNMSPVVMQVA